MKKEIILSTSKLSKSFGDLLALDKVSINIPKNSIFGILGPNGSGKSTLMRILSGLIRSWSGSIYFKNISKSKKYKALVTAGPTHEYIDPVRFISNKSSGKQGYALAKSLSYLSVKVI